MMMARVLAVVANTKMLAMIVRKQQLQELSKLKQQQFLVELQQYFAVEGPEDFKQSSTTEQLSTLATLLKTAMSYHITRPGCLQLFIACLLQHRLQAPFPTALEKILQHPRNTEQHRVDSFVLSVQSGRYLLEEIPLINS